MPLSAIQVHFLLLVICELLLYICFIFLLDAHDWGIIVLCKFFPYSRFAFFHYFEVTFRNSARFTVSDTISLCFFFSCFFTTLSWWWLFITSFHCELYLPMSTSVCRVTWEFLYGLKQSHDYRLSQRTFHPAMFWDTHPSCWEASCLFS